MRHYKRLFSTLYMIRIKVLSSHIRIVNGTVKAGDKIRMMATGAEFEVIEVGDSHTENRTTSMN